MSTEALIRSLTHDKKFEDGQVRFVLLRSAGDAFVSHDVTLRDIESAIENLRSEPQSA
jgi:3-dehydroquinate synthetase